MVQVTTFSNLKPWFMKCQKESNTCWKYHTELVELKISLNNMLSKNGGMHANWNCWCDDVCCPIGLEIGECCAYQLSFLGLTTLWNSILCPKPEGDDWHKRDCLMGECNLCGIKTLKIRPIKQVQSTWTMQWQIYVKVVVGQKDNGDARKVIQFQYMDNGTPKFMDYLCPRLKNFVTHNFIAKWQDKVELPWLILPFKIFEGPLEVLRMCKLFYIGHLTYKFSVFYKPFCWDCV